MTGRPLRAVLVFVAALVALSGVAYVVQQTLYVRPPVRDLTPGGAAAYVAAPVARPAPTAGAAAGAGSGAGVPQVDPAWLRRTAGAAGLPEAALGAYARAELASPRSCGLGWTTLAGIGWVESQHGTLGGRTLGADGRSSTRILGPALDGEGPFAAIRATPETTGYHGDPDWDHALGPMQFIPTTWEQWAADGDGDGVRDPHDLDDAALAAADYLCAGGRDLTTGQGWTDAVLSYNNARAYVDAVHSAATTYADRTG
ncbi:lytic murein transglycosylase [Nocardioides rubriscoriae]|uniref:lytic murein transglycosylase n=1 Tax=Nocardioides rubriscoriae TaxID=642762 RepID=UPI0011DF82EB|nr:lytic murein transglycosylase [Nocardioides rubriscoriae]